jgi:L-ribulose-5-phosphate 3-epimerase
MIEIISNMLYTTDILKAYIKHNTGANMKKYEIGMYEKAVPNELLWKEKLLAAGEVGYDFVEISIDESEAKLSRLEMSRDERLNLTKIMSETQVPFRSMCLSGHRKYPLGSSNPEVCSRGMEIMRKALELSYDLGIRMIQIAGSDVYYEKSTNDTKNRFLDNLQKSVEMAAKYGVTLGFETMETEFMNTVEKAMHYVNLINSSYLNVYPDMGNITNAAVAYKTDVLEDIRKGAGHTIAVHLKETIPGFYREIPFGTGHVNFPAVIHEEWKLGVRRYVTELWYTGNPEWKQDLKTAHDMMSTLLDQESIEEE